MDYKAAMAEWAQRTDEVFLSTENAGRKIVDAIISYPLTIDDIARLSELAGQLAAHRFSATMMLERHIEALRAVGAWKDNHRRQDDE